MVTGDEAQVRIMIVTCVCNEGSLAPLSAGEAEREQAWHLVTTQLIGSNALRRNVTPVLALRQAALHYALLPPSFTHTCLPLSCASAILDLPGLTQSPVYFLPYICQLCSPLLHCLLSVFVFRCSCPVACPFLIKCQLPLPASILQRYSLQGKKFHK
jgi:hypothetical protein